MNELAKREPYSFLSLTDYQTKLQAECLPPGAGCRSPGTSSSYHKPPSSVNCWKSIAQEWTISIRLWRGKWFSSQSIETEHHRMGKEYERMNCFLHWISLMWKWKDVKFIHQSCVLLCSVRCLVPSERKAELAPNHEIQESARSSSFHSFLGLLRLQLDLRCDQTKCEIGSRKQEGQPLIVR